MKNLKEDESIVIVPADKGKCLVVMDKDEYIKRWKINSVMSAHTKE